MNTTRTTLACSLIALVGIAATSKPQDHLTVQQALRWLAPGGNSSAKSYQVKVADIGQAILPATKPEATITATQEAFFATDFLPPSQALPGEQVSIRPSTPANFEKLQTGWTVRLSAKSSGKLVAVSGVADYVEAEAVPAGYGPVAAPIYADQTEVVVTPNVMNMARVQTTTTRFQIFAVPGENYEVTLYRGKQPEKHRVSVTAQ